MIDSIELLIFTILPPLLKASIITLQASIFGAIFGSIGGLCFGVLNSDRIKIKIISVLIGLYVIIVRGTPMFVQILFVYFALPEMTHVNVSPIMAGIITIGLNSSAYLSEVVRGSINSLPNGQWESAEVLGYTRYQTIRHIILPQALKNALPVITNEFSTLVKESSVLMIIGVPELVKTSRDIVARELRPIQIYLVTAFIYFVITGSIAFFTKRLERKI